MVRPVPADPREESPAAAAEATPAPAEPAFPEPELRADPAPEPRRGASRQDSLVEDPAAHSAEPAWSIPPPPFTREEAAPRTTPKRRPRSGYLVAGAALILGGLGYAGIAKFGHSTAGAGPLAFRVCSTRSVAERLVPEMIAGFLKRTGATSVDSAGGTFSADVNGRLTRIGLSTEPASAVFRDVASGTCAVAIAIAESAMPPAMRKNAKVNLAQHVLGFDGLVIVVNPVNAVAQLDLAQVSGIFSGRISNWSQVGGRNEGIEVVVPPKGSEEVDVFARALPAGTSLAASARHVDSAYAVSATVGHDRNAVGLTGFNASDPARVIKLVDRAGNTVVASSLNIAQQRYPLTRTILLYDGSQNADPVASQFVAFTQSDAGQDIVSGSNFVGRNAL